MIDGLPVVDAHMHVPRLSTVSPAWLAWAADYGKDSGWRAVFAADGDPSWPQYTPGSRLTRIFDDPPDVARYPEEASLHIWDQHRFGVLDLN